MQCTEDTTLGILRSMLNNEVNRFARMKYDGNLECFVADSVVNIGDIVNFWTKKEAQVAAKRLPVCGVDKIGGRFFKAWGLRHDLRDNYFLAVSK